MSLAMSSGIGWLDRRQPGDRLVALVLWSFSASMAGYLLATGMLDFQLPWTRGAHSVAGLAMLAPICVLGFALCPYLDGTFHHAVIAEGSRSARGPFTLGFGALFPAMILFTLGYATAFFPVAAGVPGPGPASPLLQFVILHMVFQIIYTVWLHARWAFEQLGKSPRNIQLLALVGLLPLITLVWAILHGLPRYAGMDGGEIIYRCFMSFYGLVFPAYVWICMIPTPDGHAGIDGPRGRRKQIVLAIAVLLAAPCFWMGFIERVEWWLAPGLGIVLLSRLLVRGNNHAATASSAQPA
jgi:hypothetical protein